MVDLLDALHFMFEEDLAPSTAEQQEAREKNRARIYTELYELPEYRWASPKDGSSSSATSRVTTASGQPALESSPETTELTHKEYIPPTEVDPKAAKPFGDVLDAPLG